MTSFISLKVIATSFPSEITQLITNINAFDPTILLTDTPKSQMVNIFATHTKISIIKAQKWLNTTVFELIKKIILSDTATRQSITQQLESHLKTSSGRHFLTQHTLKNLLVLSKLSWNPNSFTFNSQTIKMLLDLIVFDQHKNIYNVDNSKIYDQCQHFVSSSVNKEGFKLEHIEDSAVLNSSTLLWLAHINMPLSTHGEGPAPIFFTECIEYSSACLCIALDALTDFALALNGQPEREQHLELVHIPEPDISQVLIQLQKYRQSHENRVNISKQYEIVYQNPDSPKQASDARGLSTRLLEVLDLSKLTAFKKS